MKSVLMLSPQFSEDSSRLRTAALTSGRRVVRWSDWRLPSSLSGVSPESLFLYAPALFAERVGQLLGLRFLEPDGRWLSYLSHELLRREVISSTLREAREISNQRFFKPAGFKSFTAGVFESGQELPGLGQVDENECLLVSEVVEFASEFRFFLLDGQAITGSVYFRHHTSAQVGPKWPHSRQEYEQARRLAEEAFSARPDLLPRSVVIDVGYIEDRGWAVIEANPSWGSGLYGSDPKVVLEVIEQGVTLHSGSESSS